MTVYGKPFRPLLAATIESDKQLLKLEYPVIVSPKIDGIRCIIHPELGPVSRNLKPIPNKHVRTTLNRPELWWLDGELVVGDLNAKHQFQSSASGIMSRDGTPDFRYYIFDRWEFFLMSYDSEWRRGSLRDIVDAKFQGVHNIAELNEGWCNTPEEVLWCEEQYVTEGFEGIMIRHPQRPYKFGRSTLREQTLLKLKRFADAEAEIVGFEELQHNQNEARKDLLGLTKRSSHKDNRSAGGILGALLVNHPTFGNFSIGSGFDRNLRGEIWENQAKYLGKTITFKYQPTGVLELPRFPIFIRFRPNE